MTVPPVNSTPKFKPLVARKNMAKMKVISDTTVVDRA